MTLQIRDERARVLAEELARKRKVTMTTAVIQALEESLQAEAAKVPLAQRIARISSKLKAEAGPSGRSLDKDEIDYMWGHS